MPYTHSGTHRATGRGRYASSEPRHARRTNTGLSFPPAALDDYRPGEGEASLRTVGGKLAGLMIGDDERVVLNPLRDTVGPDSRIGRFARAAINSGVELLSLHARRVKNAGVWMGGAAALLALKPVVGPDPRSPFQAAIELMSGASEQAPGVVGLGVTAVALALTGCFASRATESYNPALEVSNEIPNGLDLIPGAQLQDPSAAIQPASVAA